MIEVEHHFLPHLYAKRTFIREGEFVPQHSHPYDHISALVKGEATVSDGVQVKHYKAPAQILIKAGIEHGVHALTDVEWYCIHITDDDNPETVDQTILAGVEHE